MPHARRRGTKCERTNRARAATTIDGNAGSVTLQFSDESHAVLTLPTGRQIALSRFDFASEEGLFLEMPAAPEDLARNFYGVWPFGAHGSSHALDGHPGWDIEFRAGAKVQRLAGSVLAEDGAAVIEARGVRRSWVTDENRAARSRLVSASTLASCASLESRIPSSASAIWLAKVCASLGAAAAVRSSIGTTSSARSCVAASRTGGSMGWSLSTRQVA